MLSILDFFIVVMFLSSFFIFFFTIFSSNIIFLSLFLHIYLLGLKRKLIAASKKNIKGLLLYFTKANAIPKEMGIVAIIILIIPGPGTNFQIINAKPMPPAKYIACFKVSNIKILSSVSINCGTENFIIVNIITFFKLFKTK